MRRTRSAALKTFAMITAGLLGAACSAATTEQDNPDAPADSLRALPRTVSVAERDGIEANNVFAIRLLRTATQSFTGNVLLSPFSVSTALGLTMNGAAGSTEEAMRNTLGWGTRTRAEINAAYRDLSNLLPTLDPAVTFKSVNAIWTREPMRAHADFIADATQYFKAGVSSAATPQAMFDAVNAWGNQATEGLIPKVLQDPPPNDLTMLLANALLFKGQWRERFDASKTAPGQFQLEGGASINTPMMTRTGGFRAAADTGVTAIELAYGNTAYSMLILVPRTASIAAFVANLDAARLSHLIEMLSPQDRSPLFMPKFRVTSSRELRPTLEAMGMGIAFSNSASFPRLFASGSGQRLEFVRHAVTVDVDEEGTKAAAVTVVGVVPVSLPASFNVNRPFLFLIRERFTGALLFTGIVRDPRQ
jgi:serine protease inhibitor